MNIGEKRDELDKLKGAFSGCQAAYVIDYKGSTCEQLTRLRKELRTKGARLAVVKNTLAKLAVSDTEKQGISVYLTGPSAVIWGNDDPVSPAKVLKEFVKEHEQVKVKGGFVDGSVVDAAGVDRVAEMPSKEALLSQLLSVINAPATKLLRTINAPGAQVARLIGALESKLKDES